MRQEEGEQNGDEGEVREGERKEKMTTSRDPPRPSSATAPANNVDIDNKIFPPYRSHCMKTVFAMYIKKRRMKEYLGGRETEGAASPGASSFFAVAVSRSSSIISKESPRTVLSLLSPP